MSLKNLIALQQKKATGNAPQATAVDSSARPADAESPPTKSDNDPDSTEQVASVDSSAPTPAPEAPAAKPKTGLGLNLIGAGRAVGTPVRPTTPASPKQRHDGKLPSASDSGNDDGSVFSLEDLAGFDASDATAPVRSSAQLGERFDDEIEATAPDRVLDPELTAQQLAFVESLDGIYPVLHDPDLFGQAVRIIMLEMQEHKEYKKLLSDQDVHTMIRGMRNTMGMAQVRKQEKSRKTGGATKKAARGKSSVSDEDMALLDQLMGGSA